MSWILQRFPSQVHRMLSTCCVPVEWPGQSTSQYLRTPVNASLARCVGTRLTKRVREQQMPCYQQQNIYNIYIVSSHRTVNVRIVHLYDNVNSLSKFSHHISIHRWTYLFSKMIGNSKPILYHRFALVLLHHKISEMEKKSIYS